MSNNPYHIPEANEPNKPAAPGPRNPYGANPSSNDPFAGLFESSRRTDARNAGPIPEFAPHEIPSHETYSYPQNEPQRGLLGTDFSFQKTIVQNPATQGQPLVPPRSTASAYALWFFLGWAGVHQFYLGNTPRGIFHLALWGTTMVLGLFGLPLGIVYFAYWVYDAVVLAEQVREINAGFIRKSVL